jgi:hypothetical protein
MTALASAPHDHIQDRKPLEKYGFRPDIQGLRAIAVGMVVLYHLFPAVLPGGFVGVDVFFVISGYLITGHLWRGYARTGTVGLADFWGRRARRLIPAAALVLTVTWIASRILEPAAHFADTVRQVLASALYYQNLQLSADAVNYLKSADAATPVQHFWSLSVEEQFYLAWPLAFLLAAFLASGLTAQLFTAQGTDGTGDARRARAGLARAADVGAAHGVHRRDLLFAVPVALPGYHPVHGLAGPGARPTDRAGHPRGGRAARLADKDVRGGQGAAGAVLRGPRMALAVRGPRP